jgi:small redox-active disulfide protein 2
MLVKILGSGCKNCLALEKATREAIDRLGIEAEVEKVTDYADIVSYGVMSTPALVVDEEVVSSGRVLTPTHIAELLTARAGGAIADAGTAGR